MESRGRTSPYTLGLFLRGVDLEGWCPHACRRWATGIFADPLRICSKNQTAARLMNEGGGECIDLQLFTKVNFKLLLCKFHCTVEASAEWKSWISSGSKTSCLHVVFRSPSFQTSCAEHEGFASSLQPNGCCLNNFRDNGAALSYTFVLHIQARKCKQACCDLPAGLLWPCIPTLE